MLPKEFTVLLAEDNRMNRVLAQNILEDIGAHVVCADNGKHALDAVRSGDDIDIILMDCNMPEMDGYAATKEIRKFYASKQKHTPIIALTANMMKGDKEKCLEAGMDDFMAKPIRKFDIDNTIKNWLGSDGSVQAQTSSQSPVESSENNSSDDNEAAHNKAILLDKTAYNLAKQTMKARFPLMVEYFLEDTQDYIATIEKAIAANTLQDAALASHTIKSSARSLGAIKLSNIAQDIEFTARNALETEGVSTQTLTRLCTEIKHTFEQTGLIYKKLLEQL